MKRKTIFLDLDGVILDVSERIYRVYKNILKKYNKKFLSKDKYLKLKREKTSIEEILEKTKAEDIAIKFKREWDKEIEKPDYLALDKVSYLNKKTLSAFYFLFQTYLLSKMKYSEFDRLY